MIQSVKMNILFSFTVGRMIPHPDRRWNKCSRTKVRIPSFTIWPSYQINDRLSLSFEGTLKLFQDFLRSEFSDENMEFWLACQDYRSSSSADELRSKARSIYEKFLQPSACREVSVADSCLVWVQKRQNKHIFVWHDVTFLHVLLLQPLKFRKITKQKIKNLNVHGANVTAPEHVVFLFSHF